MSALPLPLPLASVAPLPMTSGITIDQTSSGLLLQPAWGMSTFKKAALFPTTS